MAKLLIASDSIISGRNCVWSPTGKEKVDLSVIAAKPVTLEASFSPVKKAFSKKLRNTT